MKSVLKLLFPAAGLLCAVSGCVTVGEDSAPPAATQADVGYLREEIRRLNARLDATDGEIGRLQGELQASRAAAPDTASAAEVRSVQTQLDDVQQQVRAVDAARIKDRQEIYDDIAKKVSSLMKSSAPARAAARSPSQTGIEHVVQPGETLSVIASAYGVKLSVLVQANQLKSADQIKVGQKLFIPD